MNVLYDNQIFHMQKFGGISRYFYELISNSENLYNPYISAKYNETNEYTKKLELYRDFPVNSYFLGKYTLISFLNQIETIKKIKTCSEIFHPTYYNNYFIGKAKKCKIVLTVYDMIHEKVSNTFINDDTAESKKNAVFAADTIIAISESTKKDMLEIYPSLSPEKIKVVYLGSSLHEIHNKNRSKDYILYVGQRWAYKNFENFTKAVAPLLFRYNLKLKCTGQPFSQQELDMFSSLGIQHLVERIFVNDEELSSLYSNALLFVFPSLYEGFGLPVLEAFASGCPVIASNSSSLPEIGGNAAVYFDPLSISDIQQKIQTVIISETLQDDLIQKGYQQLKNFSWRKCAEETAEIYKQVLQQ